MIDYEKLKEAHRLCQKYTNLSGLSVYLQIQFRDKVPLYNCHLDNKPSERIIDSDLDLIIKKLNYLMEKKPKYEIGHLLFWSDGVNVNNHIVKKIEFDEAMQDYAYESDHYRSYENSSYLSAHEAIMAQIEYWKKQIDEGSEHVNDAKHYLYPRLTPNFPCEPIVWDNTKICKHEPDGNIYCSNPPQNRCVKCGEYYR